MLDITMERSKQAQLRFDAEVKLQQGTAPPTQGWTLSEGALALLYRLAKDPVSAGDGLKLLHELQTHQVELDLQQEQLEANAREFAEDLARYKALYDAAPVGYFVVGRDGRIQEGNRAGAAMLGMAQDDVGGCRLERFLAPESRVMLVELLEHVSAGVQGASCVVQFGSDDSHPDGATRLLRIAANVAPGGDAFLLAVSEYD